MSDLATDYYDEGVIKFLQNRKIVEPIFIVAVDRAGRAHGFAAPGTEFRRIQDVGTQREDSNGDGAWWCVENNPGVTAGIGGGKWRWP
jgi:hypothetical protein